ncbi:glycosyltransferase [Methylophaga pinxianii]|uniref:glycosyltransferase n=1 Tax=Methylophaga pinxianii TaxID=2881052 RepID=UPI001CF4612F|nr:glycosyltransferase [Methylophaga pinxianii]MCB2426892.1 glycosyltransferase [Methylophaga pinxianii]UPH45656.1 glycosyltransferase [Methylophaga pinxianii]
MPASPSVESQRYILQLCHSYYDPFLDCARQYSVLFKDTSYKVITVFLSGKADPVLAEKVCSDEVIFLEHSSEQLSGLKLNIIREIRRISMRYDFVACIAHRAKPTYVALIATKLPVLSIRHSFGDFDRLGRRLLVKCFYSRLKLLAVSNAVRDEIRQHLPSWPPEKIETLYNRINVADVQAQQLSRSEARKALNLPEDAWVVGSVGRIHPDKDPQSLIRGFAKALPQLPKNSLLVLIGKGKLMAELTELIEELNLTDHIWLLGQINDAKKFFRAFDVFALSSDREPFGMVLLEAMAAELPIICTDCGGGAEIIEGIGKLYRFRDLEAFSHQLIELSQTTYSQEYKSNISNRLITTFSDEAVRQVFWQRQYIPS